MRNFLFVFALVLGGTAGSCFSPDLTGVTFKCDPAAANSCPDDQQCSSQGTCVPIGTVTPPPGMDMATTALLIPAEGCPSTGSGAGLGFDVTASGKPTVYACPVKFQKQPGQTADMQCKAPYMLCTNATNIDLTACTKAGQYASGYFIANVEANRPKQGGAGSCGTPSGFQVAMWAGCGRAATAVNCSGFASALECGGGSFQCQGTMITDTINSDGSSGVLCCHP